MVGATPGRLEAESWLEVIEVVRLPPLLCLASFLGEWEEFTLEWEEFVLEWEEPRAFEVCERRLL